ncbi:MAG TPA: FecR domain-containing protein [Edaphobacter sp.]|uniref:FecR domain-containing protein n=1 Tax=Edaphobacter sp. TaxID=1934404 RepID=UPI002C788440|nr:FecR domain-containing protein [Edaphobacter sp.]HUZ96955.1 FecR domain-containing protein [Edaphobacter sp.]
MPRLKALLILSLATLAAPAFGQNANPASPGTLNYVEGQASIEGRPLSHRSVGRTEMQAGQVIATANGKAEILLTPGIFLRLGDNSTVQMVSPNLTHTEVRLERGDASVEVDQIYKESTVLIDTPNGQTQLLKHGLYGFDANNSTVRVFDGKAAVYPGQNLQSNIKPIEVKGGRQLVLNGEMVKPQRFNKGQAKNDDLYQWSSLRSAYLGDANIDLASEYAGYGGFTPGWYWAGGPFGYTWLPGNGLFWNPFGYGFYSPLYLYGGGAIYGGYGYGGYGYGGYGGYGYGGYGYNGGGYGTRRSFGNQGQQHGYLGGHPGPVHAPGSFHGGAPGGFRGGGGFHGGGGGGGGGGFHGGGGGGGGGSHGGGGGGGGHR